MESSRVDIQMQFVLTVTFACQLKRMNTSQSKSSETSGVVSIWKDEWWGLQVNGKLREGCSIYSSLIKGKELAWPTEHNTPEGKRDT